MVPDTVEVRKRCLVIHSVTVLALQSPVRQALHLPFDGTVTVCIKVVPSCPVNVRVVSRDCVHVVFVKVSPSELAVGVIRVLEGELESESVLTGRAVEGVPSVDELRVDESEAVVDRGASLSVQASAFTAAPCIPRASKRMAKIIFMVPLLDKE